MREMVLSGTFLETGAQEKMAVYERHTLASQAAALFYSTGNSVTLPFECSMDYADNIRVIEGLSVSQRGASLILSAVKEALTAADMDQERLKALCGAGENVELHPQNCHRPPTVSVSETDPAMPKSSDRE